MYLTALILELFSLLLASAVLICSHSKRFRKVLNYKCIFTQLCFESDLTGWSQLTGVCFSILFWEPPTPERVSRSDEVVNMKLAQLLF